MGGYSCISLARGQKQIVLQALLLRIEIKVASLQGVEFIMCAALYDLAVLDYQDLVGAADG